MHVPKYVEQAILPIQQKPKWVGHSCFRLMWTFVNSLFYPLNTYSAPLSVNERHGSEIKQLSVAIGMVRKQSYYCTYFWPRSQRCMVASGLRQRGRGNAPVWHFWWKEGIANGLSRMNLKLI